MFNPRSGLLMGRLGMRRRLRRVMSERPTKAVVLSVAESNDARPRRSDSAWGKVTIRDLHEDGQFHHCNMGDMAHPRP